MRKCRKPGRRQVFGEGCRVEDLSGGECGTVINACRKRKTWVYTVMLDNLQAVTRKEDELVAV